MVGKVTELLQEKQRKAFPVLLRRKPAISVTPSRFLTPDQDVAHSTPSDPPAPWDESSNTSRHPSAELELAQQPKAGPQNEFAQGAPPRTESSPGCARAHRACAVQGVGSLSRQGGGRGRWRMLAEPVPGWRLLRRGWGGQSVHRAPARREGGGLGSWWMPASTPFRRCGRRPQRRNATEVGFPWAARAAGPRIKLGMPKEWGSSPEVCVSRRTRPPFSFPGSRRLPASASPRPRARRPAHQSTPPFVPRPRHCTLCLTAPLSPQPRPQCRPSHSHAHFPVCLWRPEPPFPRTGPILFPHYPFLSRITPRPSLHPPFI